MAQAVVAVAGWVASTWTAIGSLGIIGGAIQGAIIGGAIGGLTSAVTGGDIGKGILFGAVGGAVLGGKIGAALGAPFGVNSVTLVSRSGMHIAGDVPKGAHLETFVAMSAILVGAAETATNELRESLGFITIDLSEGQLILHSISNKALVVMGVDKDIGDTRSDLESTFDELEEHL